MSLNQSIITEVLNELKNGKLRRCLDMGFTHEDLVALKNPEILTLLVNTSVPWSRIIVNPPLLRGLINSSGSLLQEAFLINRMLRLCASSKMICEVFGLTQREVAFRRSLLGMEKRQGRWTELTEEQENELWRYWLTLIDKYHFDVHNEHDLAKSCMWLAEEKNLTMAQLWMAIQKWVKEGLHS
ncbi:STY4526/YPO1902 family pathogenicity island replication protein [Saezia sanguinis]|uniref:STY4526/YPO1902 family pathogenicity island replication protein n=1 Tax=Saezia sanguinis TaxID=1965230 RepID=UPI003068D70C